MMNIEHGTKRISNTEQEISNDEVGGVSSSTFRVPCSVFEILLFLVINLLLNSDVEHSLHSRLNS